MKYVKEIVIIFGITMVGELLNMFIPLPVPAGVYGLFILLGGLCTKVISLSDVEVTGNLLLDLMPVMFIPAAGPQSSSTMPAACLPSWRRSGMCSISTP